MSSRGFSGPETAYLNGRVPETCGDCGDDTIYPVDGSWQTLGRYGAPQQRVFKVLLTCPNCEEDKEPVVLDTPSQKEFTRVMLERKEKVRYLYSALVSYNTSLDFEMLGDAIQSGDILPEDF
ncbi:MAG: hypothetical protein AAB462_02920 [Patescibacteria group bacterium]